MTIKQIAQSDREVREKLASRGAESLSDVELLSVILQEGVANISALDLANKIVDQYEGSLHKISKTSISALRMCEGIGVKRSAMVLSAIELGRRAEREGSNAVCVIQNSEDIVALFKPMISMLPHEEFWALYLSGANSVLDKMKVSQGSANHVIVDHKLIVKRAVELLASAIVVVHNHPSGVAQPSTEDKELTQKLIKAASLFEINLIDHIIITQTESLSFKQLGLI